MVRLGDKAIKRLGYCVIGLILCGCTHPFMDVENTPVGNFEALWQIIDEKYCFLDEKKVDWDSVYSAYHPRFEKMQVVDYEDNYVYFDLMEVVVNELEDGHVNLYSYFDVSYCTSWYDGYPINFDSELLMQKYLNGYRQAGGLIYNRIHNDSIGYVYYGSFSDNFSLANAVAVFNYFKDCRGIVLDVRNNGGGSMENAYKLASLFYPQDTIVGYWQHKSGPGRSEFSSLEPMKLEDAKGYWQRPVIVLCNRNSYSATNFFVSIMRNSYLPHSLVMGGISGGGGGMPMSYELPNGWTVRFSSVKMYDIDKRSIESGIKPDVLDTLISRDYDDIIENAVRIINNAYDKR